MALAIVGCDNATQPTTQAAPIAVAVAPTTASLQAGGHQDFTATVANDPATQGVTWSITGCTGGSAVCGTLTNVTSTTVTYTAPGTVPPGDFGVTATSVADNTKSFTATVAVTAAQFVSLSAGWDFACGVTAAGAAFCWGDGGYGELGTGDVLDRHRPTLVAGGVQFAAVQAGTSHTCGVTAAGAAYCWGWNQLGQLGDGNLNDLYRTSPTLVVGGVRFAAVTVGQIHTCGLTAAGAAYCWGSNGRGELGRGIDLNIDPVLISPVPLAVSGGLSFAAVTAGGGDHTCGRTAAGVAYCWGVNNYGQIGDGTSGTDRPGPVPVTGGVSFAALSAGSGHTCGVTAAGDAYCWGVNFTGQLGDGTTTHRSSPVPVVGGLKFASVSAGGYSDHTCALTAAGAAYCWGYNQNGQLGDGTTTEHLTPVPVAGGLTFAAVTVGASYTCGVTLSGDAYCWGYNGYGRLGDGTTTDRHTPTRVVQ